MKLKYARTAWKPNKTILKGIMWSTIGMYIGLLAFCLNSVYNKQGFLSSFYACLGQETPVSETGLSWSGILVLGFLLTTIFSSVIMDFLCLWKLRTFETDIKKNKGKSSRQRRPPTGSKFRKKSVTILEFFLGGTTQVEPELELDNQSRPSAVASMATTSTIEASNVPGSPKEPREELPIRQPLSMLSGPDNSGHSETSIKTLQAGCTTQGLSASNHNEVPLVRLQTASTDSLTFTPVSPFWHTSTQFASLQPNIDLDASLRSPLPLQLTIPERKIIDEIPIRSSLFNTLFLVPYIFIVIVLAHIGGDFLDQDKRDLMGVPFFAMTIVRTWLVATLTFKKNDSNQQRNADQERERKRQIEIQDALEKRKKREEGTHFYNFG